MICRTVLYSVAYLHNTWQYCAIPSRGWGCYQMFVIVEKYKMEPPINHETLAKRWFTDGLTS